MAGATLWQRRFWFGVAAFLVGEAVSLSINFILGLPFLALALWQLFRHSKANRERLAAARAQTKPDPTQAPEVRTGPPPPSRRYTPPKRSTTKTRSLRGGDYVRRSRRDSAN
jgi:hypothetical protein